MLRIKTGTYTGNGSDNRAITGVGFQPNFVFLKPTDTTANGGAISWSNLGSDKSFEPGGSSVPVANLIQSFDSDGFTIGNSDNVNKNTVPYIYVAIYGDTNHLYMGSYSGDGVDNRTIGGPGWSPGLVIVKRTDTGANAIFKFSSFPTGAGGGSTGWQNVGLFSNRIQQMVSTGFEIGTNNTVNNSSGTYHYIAIKLPAGAVTSSYSGNATDDRNITGLGIDPIFVWVKGDTTEDCVFRTNTHSGDLTSVWSTGSTADVANAIQSLGSGQFQVGTDNRVNASGITYYYLAIRDIIVTPTAPTKTLLYKVKAKVSATKTLLYKIKTKIVATKTLLYKIKTKPLATKTLLYKVKAKPSITKTILYKVKTTIAITKDLVYEIVGVTEVVINKTLLYKIKTIIPVTKTLLYKIVAKVPVTKTLLYKIIATVKITKTLLYKIKTTIVITKALLYKIKTEITATKTLLYKILTSIPVTKALLYKIKNSIVTTKTLLYKILVNTSITKTLLYKIKKVIAITKGLLYKIKASNALTLDLSYAIEIEGRIISGKPGIMLGSKNKEMVLNTRGGKPTILGSINKEQTIL